MDMDKYPMDTKGIRHYPDLDTLYKRAESLRKIGIWTGVREATLSLCHDPPFSTAELDSHGYMKG